MYVYECNRKRDHHNRSNNWGYERIWKQLGLGVFKNLRLILQYVALNAECNSNTSVTSQANDWFC